MRLPEQRLEFGASTTCWSTRRRSVDEVEVCSAFFKLIVGAAVDDEAGTGTPDGADPSRSFPKVSSSSTARQVHIVRRYATVFIPYR